MVSLGAVSLFSDVGMAFSNVGEPQGIIACQKVPAQRAPPELRAAVGNESAASLCKNYGARSVTGAGRRCGAAERRRAAALVLYSQVNSCSVITVDCSLNK